MADSSDAQGLWAGGFFFFTRGSAYSLCSVFPPSHYVSRTHCRSPAFSHACSLAWMSMNVEVVKGAKSLHEVH